MKTTVVVDVRGGQHRLLTAFEAGPLPLRARFMLACGGTVATTATSYKGRASVTLGVHPPTWLSVLGVKPWTWHEGNAPVAS